MDHLRVKFEKEGQEDMIYSKYFNYNYMYFVGYDTCHILIWTSVEGSINTNKISIQGIPKTHINKVSPLSKKDLVAPHIKTLLISCKKIWFHANFKPIHQKKREFHWGIYVELVDLF